VLFARQSPETNNVNTGAEKTTSLAAVFATAGQHNRLKRLVCALVNCRVCELAIVVNLLAVAVL
jgi:hypothetical protein